MKKIVSILCLLQLCSHQVYTQQKGYHFEVTFADTIPDQYVYLAHYFGKYGKDGKPTIYSIDSAKVINKNKAVFSKKDSFLGGIHMVLYNNRSQFFQLLVDNGYKFSVKVNKENQPTFKSSPENDLFSGYEQHAYQIGKERQSLVEAMKLATTKKDSLSLQTKLTAITTLDTKYKKDFVLKNPTSLTSLYLRAMEMPNVPLGNHYLADGKTIDSMYAFNYIKSHYWDQFDFRDNRLINSPIYDSKLQDYFSNYIYPVPDTINEEGDKLLVKAKDAKELFKYTLHWLAGYTTENKYMGLDESFIHFVEKYYMNGVAYWLDSASLAKYIDKAQKIAPTVLGNTAPELLLQDAFTLADRSLLKMDAKYTVMIFWRDDCGTCQQTIPKLLEEYHKELKAKEVKVFSVLISGELKKIQQTLTKMELSEWTNVVDAHQKYKYEALYNVTGTPHIFVLDKDKKIIAKGINWDQINGVLDFHNKKQHN